MTRQPRLITFVLVALVLSAKPVVAQDLDRDGLADPFEQALLERFLPTFVLSAGECDGRPAAMVPGTPDPRVLVRDGTIYGHVMRRGAATRHRVEIEIQYFHLWSRDCGRPSHQLDAEHVSTLVYAAAADAALDAWQAEYWYAAAHEGTVCDASSGAPAAALRAASGGPFVYVSRGKHASYLLRGQCKWGCGSDLCDPGDPLPRAPVVNLGEPGAPLNGATWVQSRQWALAARLSSDFEPAFRARLDADGPSTVQTLRIGLRPLQAPILGGDTGLDALIMAGDATVDAVATTAEATSSAAGATGRAVGTAATRTARGLAWFFHRK
jgi:hypothetical protein